MRPIDELEGRVTRRASRRRFLGLIATGLGGSAAASLLASCAPSAPAPTAAPAKPTEAAKPAAPAPAPTPPAPAPPTAPAAAPGAPATASPADQAAPAAVKPGGTLTVAIGTEVSGLDAHTTTDTDTVSVRNNVFEHLVEFDDQMKLAPALATSWDVAPDGVTYSFKLRSGVKFHDGTPLNSEAVKFNVERLIAPSWTGQAKTVLSMIAAVETPDDMTVRIKTAQPFGAFLSHLATSSGHIMSPTAVKQLGQETASKAVGTGPYRFVEWRRGDRVVFERNPDHWGSQGKLERLIYRIVPEEAARVTLLQTGEADVVQRIPPNEVPRFRNHQTVELIETETDRTVFFYFNVMHPLFANKTARQAVYHGVDRAGILRAVLQGAGVLADSTLARTQFGYASQKPYEYDVNKAKELLNQAGVMQGHKLMLISPAGRYVRDKQIAEAVQGQLQQLGFDVELQVTGDFPAYQQQMTTMNHDMALVGWSGGTADGDYGLYQLLHPSLAGKPWNHSGTNNARIGQLLDSARATVDQQVRQTAYAEIQKIVMEEAIHLASHYQVVYTGVNKRVEGVSPRPTEHLIVKNASMA